MIKTLDILQTKFHKQHWYLTELRDKVLSGNIVTTTTKTEWSLAKQSQYIETIILGFPLHQILLAANEEIEELTIIDGHQRINSIMNFYGKELPIPLTLQDLRIRSELNGMTYQDIQSNPLVPDLTATFDRKLINIIVIQNSSPEIIREVQTRINA